MEGRGGVIIVIWSGVVCSCGGVSFLAGRRGAGTHGGGVRIGGI